MEAPTLAGASQHSESTGTVENVDSTAYLDLVRLFTNEKDETVNNPGNQKSSKRSANHPTVYFPGDSLYPAHHAPLPLPIDGKEESVAGLKALDYLSTVYEETDYYESGYYGKAEEPLEKVIFSGPLPPCGLEDLALPVNGHITSPFGMRGKGSKFHKGVDIHLCKGDTVCAALSGNVTRIGYERRGYGHFIIVGHPNGVETRYAHLQKILVKPGEYIRAGTPIALGGTSGNSTGPHLHFEIRDMGRAIGPQRICEFTAKE